MRCVGELFHLSVLPPPSAQTKKDQKTPQQQSPQQPTVSDPQQSQTSFSWKDLSRLVQTLQAGVNSAQLQQLLQMQPQPPQQQQQQQQQSQSSATTSPASANASAASASASNAVDAASNAGILALLAALPFASKKEPPKRMQLQVELRKVTH